MKDVAKVSPKVRASLIAAGYTDEEVDAISDFGKRIRVLRVKAGNMRQGELAKVMGVVTTAVGKYETKPDSYPSIEVLLKLSKFFNVSTDFLLKGVSPPQMIEQKINGNLNNSSFVQGDNSNFVMHGKELSPEAAELVRLYNNLDGQNRLKLLKYVIELGEKDDEIKHGNKKSK